MDNYISEAFDQICKEALVSEKHYVVLYADEPFYGGPEEEGWWSANQIVVKYQQFDTAEAAYAAKEKIQKLAEELSAQAKKEYGQHCLNQLEWLEARGLDSDFLPEVDGETRYFVEVINEVPSNHYGCTHYE